MGNNGENERKGGASLSRDELSYGIAALGLYRRRLKGLDPTGITPLEGLARMCDGAIAYLSGARGGGGRLTPAELPAGEAAMLREAVLMLTDELGGMAPFGGSPLGGAMECLRGLDGKLRGNAAAAEP